ncbi:MAG: VapC toxin family PIN domain ribonuclease [Verrucomicrobiota bacterium]|nr:VapC toxin family PIN domain ribonuclease [Verrucomicrobiota bacterium]
MSFLLDVNVLVAWGWQDHVDHRRTVHWIAAQKKRRRVKLATSPIPEIGFVRVAVQRGLGRVTISEAAEVLESMLQSLGDRHRFLPDDVSGTVWPDWCRRPADTTDAHLARLAEKNGLKLATLDTEIPNALLLPLMAV